MASQEPTSLVERVQDFVAEHKKAIILTAAAAAIAAGGVAYYNASTSRPRPGGKDRDVEKGEKKKKSKKKKSSSSKDAGPILEEKKTKIEQDEDAAKEYTTEDVAAMSTEERATVAASLKAKGNAAYTSKNFALAVSFYTKAIKVTPKPEPVYFSNRAACYVNMTPPKHDLVVEDCNEALKLDPTYVKALNRRAMALEALDKLEDALRDFTAATILDKFQNATTASAVERVLKVLATQKTQEILKNREPRLPSYTFITAYFAAFRPRSHPPLPETPSQGDQTLQLALDALDAGDYVHSVTLVNEAIEQGISWLEGQAEAFNLRGTYKFLIGEVEGAKKDLEESIKLIPGFTQSLVKIASVHMEQGDPEKAFECFEEAIKQNPKDPDIYYHRGQVLFIMNEYTKAAENYVQSSELDDQFVFSHIQLAVAEYKGGQLAKAMATFRRTLRNFPNKSEAHNYYGELLLDQQRFEDALEKFDKAFEIEKSKPRPNVLPLVNKGLALYQFKQDIGAAERCCHEALRIDSECEAAVATLAQLSLQQSKIKEAVELFHRQTELARTEPELLNALTYEYATKAQVQFLHAYPQMAAQLASIASGMLG